MSEADKPVPAPTNIRSLNTRIENLARKHGIAPNLLHHQLASYVVTEMLQRSRAATGEGLFLIKGGTAIQMRLGLARSRFSKDLDAVFRGTVQDIVTAASAALAADWHGFTAKTARPKPINVPGMPVKPMRFDVQLQYRGQSFAKVPVEVSIAEAGSASTADEITPAAFATIGMEALGLPDVGVASLMPLEYQIAQKLHACSDPGEPPRDNERTHDVVDLLLLLPLLDESAYAATRRACVEIFTNRSRQDWPPQVRAYPDWSRLYRTAVADILEPPELPATVEEAIETLQRYIERIEAAAP